MRPPALAVKSRPMTCFESNYDCSDSCIIIVVVININIFI